MSRWRRFRPPKHLLQSLQAETDYTTRVYRARCPLHRGAGRLFVLAVSTPPALVLHCARGCPETRIQEALRLPQATLRPYKRRCEVVYTYQNANGRPVLEVRRWVPKWFSVRYLVGQQVPLVLYRLPELRAAPPDTPVFLVEGEKDVETLRALQLVAITSPLGARKWRDEYARWLAGRTVILLPDQDAPGAAFSEAARRSLEDVGCAVRCVALPGLGHQEDVSDWLAHGHTKDDLLLAVGLAELPALGRLGSLELAVLRAVHAGQRRGAAWVRRDELPARLWGRTQDDRHDVDVHASLRYTHTEREAYRRGQASPSRTLTSLTRKGLLVRRGRKEMRLTVRGVVALNFSPTVSSEQEI